MLVIWIVVVFCMSEVYSERIVDCDVNKNPGGIIEMTEIDDIDTAVLTFNNSFGDITWSASINGTNSNYLSLFFKSNTTEGAPHTHALLLSKKLDLELLQLDLIRTSGELFEAINGYALVIDLTTSCKNTAGRNQEMRFKVVVHPVNEFNPQFMGAPFRILVPEFTEVGTNIFNIGSKVSDQDAGKTNLTFAIVPYVITQFDGSQYVKISNEEYGMIQLTKTVDFETFIRAGRAFMFINVTATDDGGLMSFTSINVTIQDNNDQGIDLIYPGCHRPCLHGNYTVVTNESYVGLLTVSPAQVMAKDLDTLNEPVIYSLDSGNQFFRIDRSTGALYKTAPLINDTYGPSLILNVTMREESNADHTLDTSVLVQFSDRLSRIIIYILFLSIFHFVLCDKSDHHGEDGDIRQRLHNLEEKQRLTDRKVDRLEEIIKVQGEIITKQSDELRRMDRYVQNQASRTTHALRLAKGNRRRTFQIARTLRNNTVIAQLLASNTHNHINKIHNITGNTHEKQNTSHRTYDNHHTTGRPDGIQSKFNTTHGHQNAHGRNHDKQNSNGRTHNKQNTNGKIHDKQNTNGRTHDKQNTNGRTHDKQNTNGRTHDKQNTNGRTHDKQNTDERIHNKQNSNERTHDKQNTNGRTHNKQNSNGQTHNKQNTNGRSHDKQNTNGRTHDKQNSNGRTHDKQTTNGRTHDKQNSNGRTHDKQNQEESSHSHHHHKETQTADEIGSITRHESGSQRTSRTTSANR
ncbi:hypothetical protein ACF0H5_019207 [Mactra antiquata]